MWVAGGADGGAAAPSALSVVRSWHRDNLDQRLNGSTPGAGGSFDGRSPTGGASLPTWLFGSQETALNLRKLFLGRIFFFNVNHVTNQEAIDPTLWL